MNERFQFLKTYAESLNELSKADEQLAKDLARKIIQYGIYWVDEKSWNPIVEAMFVQIKLMIDKWQEITEKNRTNWKKWWAPEWNSNAVKNWENDIKQPKNNPKTTQNNQNRK